MFFFNLHAFIFSCLMVLAKTSCKMLNRIAECKHTYLDPVLREASSLSSLIWYQYDMISQVFCTCPLYSFIRL